MLIGHKPVCAFWRYSGEGEWITNTSQGGDMSYDNVPMSALELAVKASKAAKAEYWACDIAIDKKTGKPYILECATAFAAFPYIRDWIGQYIMWDLSDGRFRMPHVPLYSWEELGKMSAAMLRTMRHIYFAKYTPSADGAYWLADKGPFEMEEAGESRPDDVPEPIEPPRSEEQLPADLKAAFDENDAPDHAPDSGRIVFSEVTMTQLLTLQGMEEEMAEKIKTLIDDGEISRFEELESYDFVPDTHHAMWAKAFQ
jgi:hypothetical protein